MKKLICLALSAVMLLLATACGHKHTFADATCTEPKTCTECGETEGEALGHTVNIGQCATCGQLLNPDGDITKLANINDKLGEYFNDISGYLTDYNEYKDNEDMADMAYASLLMVGNWVGYINDEYKKVADILKKYPECSECVEKLNAVLNYELGMPKSDSKSDCISYINEFNEYIELNTDFQNLYVAWFTDVHLAWTNNS